MNKYLPQGSFFLSKQTRGLFQLKAKYYRKIRNPCQPLFLFLISDPLCLEIKASLGFDLESSEVKGRFFPQSDSVTVNTGLREAK